MSADIPYRDFCERAYREYHRPDLISPDPLEVVREESNPEDREIVALIASSLALGRVDSIVATVRSVVALLRGMGSSIATALRSASPREIRTACSGFAYRFFDETQLAGFLLGVGEAIRHYGSLEETVRAGLTPDVPRTDRLVCGIGYMVDTIVAASDGTLASSILLSRPERGSAIKRLCLFARWLVRSDEIDPGGWSVLEPAELLMPVDTHVIRVARHLGLTQRAQPSLLAAREITGALRRIDPEDPVRFDFSLTRPGINPDLNESVWLDQYRAQPA